MSHGITKAGVYYSAHKNKSFFNWVLIAKGIGIALVVVGHFYPNNSPEYWGDINKIIYSFHMPLFFILSGFLHNHTKYSYLTLIDGKVKRLIFPFISIAVLFFVIKYLSGLFFYLEHPIGLKSIYALLVNPVNSYMPLLWFVHALFLIFLVYPLTRNLISNNFVILVIFIVVNVAFGNNYAVFGNALANIPFFIIGVILRENTGVRDVVISDKWAYVSASLMIFFMAYTLMLEVDAGSQADYILRLGLGVAGAICVMNISCLIDAYGTSIGKVMLTKIGFYSMTIYFFHTLFKSTISIVFQQIFGDLQISFEVVAITAVTAGIIFPLLLEKTFLRKNVIARKYILGLA